MVWIVFFRKQPFSVILGFTDSGVKVCIKTDLEYGRHVDSLDQIGPGKGQSAV